MRYLSICSGIEAASCAWRWLDWKPLAFSEIEKFPSNVLQHHYPDIENLGDLTKITDDDLRRISRGQRIELIVGGTPCQDVSVAGRREGLHGERSKLAFEYIRLLRSAKPRWIVWENVPGVLSSNEGRDFNEFISTLNDAGYGLAWRVLDAQSFGVAQKRRRVFLVGYLGDWRPSAAVLFESESLSGDLKTSKREEQRITSNTERGSEKTGKGSIDLNTFSITIGGLLYCLAAKVVILLTMHDSAFSAIWFIPMTKFSDPPPKAPPQAFNVDAQVTSL